MIQYVLFAICTIWLFINDITHSVEQYIYMGFIHVMQSKMLFLHEYKVHFESFIMG